MRTVSPVVLALGLLGCAGSLEDVVRLQAAHDLRCPEDQVAVRDLRSRNYVRDYEVQACGRAAHYQAACSMVGSCVAYEPRDVEEDARTASGRTYRTEEVHGGDPSMGVEYTQVVERPVAEPAAAPAPAPVVVAPPGPDALELTLRNACTATVTVFVGEAPNQGGGRYMTLASTNMTTLRVRPEEKVWLVDASGHGLAGVTVDASMRELEVSPGCTGLSAR
jgi:hypothetical protein